MIVRCPRCRAEFRRVDYPAEGRVVKYLCPGCGEIVPIDLELDEVRSSSSSSSFRARKRRRVVLVADDSEDLRLECERLLTAAGYRVATAADGEEALRRIREEHPDAVLLDLLMPRMTGFDVLRELRQDERLRETPVLAMSGVYKESIVEFLQHMGARGFLDKAHVAATLVFRIQALLPAQAAGD
jgi:CheY-like chemotaxis protein